MAVGIPGDIEGAAGDITERLREFVLVDPSIDVDGVTHIPDDIRRLVLERHQRATELASLKRLLELRSAAVNRLSEDNERLRRQLDGACTALENTRRGGW